MYDYNEAEEVKIKLKTIGQWAMSAFLDALFLVCWVFIQWVVQNVIIYLNLSGIDKWMLVTFQVLFSIATLIPIIAYIVRDIVKVIFRTWAQIQYERFLLQEFTKNKLKSKPDNKISDSINTEGAPNDSPDDSQDNSRDA